MGRAIWPYGSDFPGMIGEMKKKQPFPSLYDNSCYLKGNVISASVKQSQEEQDLSKNISAFDRDQGRDSSLGNSNVSNVAFISMPQKNEPVEVFTYSCSTFSRKQLAVKRPNLFLTLTSLPSSDPCMSSEESVRNCPL